MDGAFFVWGYSEYWFIYMKRGARRKMFNEKRINALLATDKFLCELLDIVSKEHPKIIVQAILQTVDKYPELFKKGKDEER